MSLYYNIQEDRARRYPSSLRLLCRRARRWLGWGCKAVPWNDAVRQYQCELSRGHNRPHIAHTANGPVAWADGGGWDMPPLAPFVRESKEREFELSVWNRVKERYMKVK